MNDDTTKQTPASGPPTLATADFDETDDGGGAPLRVTLDVDNGHAAERYHFHYEATMSGAAEVELTDAFRDVEAARAKGETDPEQVRSLLGAVDLERLQFSARQKYRFPPGSLIGRLTISDGTNEVTHLFMADPEQAKTAGIEPDPQLQEILEKLYEAGAAHLDRDDIRP